LKSIDSVHSFLLEHTTDNMKFSLLAVLGVTATASALPNIQKRQAGQAQFTNGQPIAANGNGGPILGMCEWLQ
jgi:hypothetical protein